MTTARRRQARAAVPTVLALSLLLAACGSADTDIAQQPAAPVAGQAGASTELAKAKADTEPSAALVEAVADYLDAQAERDAAAGNTAVGAAGPATKEQLAGDEVAKPALENAIKAVRKSREADSSNADRRDEDAATGERSGGSAVKAVTPTKKETKTEAELNRQRFEQTDGATDMGVTRTSIKTGTIMMHGMALARLTTKPQIAGMLAAITGINDRGGILGRRISNVDCDDGPGEVSRTKACLKKLVAQDKIFSLLTVGSWGSASIHDDLANYQLPLVGAWAYSQTEWQDPYMFPTHMSMIHEAMAAANWVKDVIKPKTYGLICLTSPEMQLSCNQVQKILDASGAEMVKKVDVGIAETSMSAQVLAMRAAAPDHIVHYVINPATTVKFLVESAQQGYYPPQGISGNHMASEVLGSLLGDHPAGRYWTNTTYKLWGSEFMSTMNKYARSSGGSFHHIVQAGYVGVNLFAEAAKAVGPNLTRERLMAALGNGTVWKTDASLDQKFSFTPAERGGTYENQTWDPKMGQGREYMYRYVSPNTVSNPDGSPSGFEPDPTQFVITTQD